MERERKRRGKEQFEEDEKFYYINYRKNSIGEAFASPIVI
jgi:hypothetical protein